MSISWKHLLFLAFYTMTASLAICQKTAIQVHAYSGLFYFRGSGSSSTTAVNRNAVLVSGNLRPFGRRPTYAYAADMQLQRVSRENHLYGLGAGWEEFESNTLVDSMKGGLPNQPTLPAKNTVKDKITISTSFLTFNPFIGQRFCQGKFIFDIKAGLDISLSTKLKEKAYYSPYSIGTYEPYYRAYRKKPFGDIRPRAQVDAYYKRIGISAGYSIGLVNFQNEETGSTQTKAYTNFFRCGLGYRF